MRGAGCCWNDIADRNLDGLVERTSSRPIPAGEITVLKAIIFMAMLSVVGFTILVSFNVFAVGLGVFSLSLILIYPFMKRITWWPQIFLGFTFNWGALLGWAAIEGNLDWPPAILYLAGIAWTLGYDTIYAHQDKEDDALVGIKSSALVLGENTRPALFIFYGVTIFSLLIIGEVASLSFLYYGGMGLATIQLIWQAIYVDLKNPSDCLTKFRSNTWFGCIVFISIVADRTLL